MSSVEPVPEVADPQRERYTVNSLARGLSVLECFVEHPGPFRLKTLAEKLRVEKATLFRYCVTLQDRGYLELDSLTKEYRLGPKVRELGMAERRQLDLLGVIRTWLPEIAERYGGTASFGVLAGSEVAYVDRATTEGSLGYSFSIGTRLTVTRSSIGKVILANLTPEVAEGVIGSIPEKAARTKLSRELEDTRRNGFAINMEGGHPGVNSAAAVVRDPSSGQPVGGLNVAATAEKFTKKRLIGEVGPFLLEVAEKIERSEPAPT